jgi:hypothetical protein
MIVFAVFEINSCIGLNGSVVSLLTHALVALRENVQCCYYTAASHCR